MARLTDNTGRLLGGLETLPPAALSPLTPTQRSTSAVVTAPAPPQPVRTAPLAAHDRRSVHRAK